MSSRPMSDYEVQDFLTRHSDVRQAINDHESEFGYNGYRKWDQVILSREASWLPIPPRGLSVTDSAYGNVIIFPDASGVIHFTTTDNGSLADEIRKPVFQSDPDYWELYATIAAKYKEAAAGVLNFSEMIPIALLLVLAIIYLPRR